MSRQSFGNLFHYKHSVFSADSISHVKSLFSATQKPKNGFLCFGKGRSYGDSCLNADGHLIDTSFLTNIVEFDTTNGTIKCEPGATIGQIIDLVSPSGWFIPVTPGTKHVTIGGAVANDVHGKNHHVRGSFGNNILSLALLRSSGELLTLKPGEKMFEATVGGLGLTGIITEVEIQLIKASSWFDIENIKFGSLKEFYQLSEESERDWEYTVAWIDTCAEGASLGKGIFMRGNHSNDPSLPIKFPSAKVSIPTFFPNFTLNNYTVKAFNWLYYNKQLSDRDVGTVHYEPYLYPLDSVKNWNKIYGRRGFYQYQFVIPGDQKDALKDILNMITTSKNSSFLSVLKHFGDYPPAGMLSFAQKGIMLALDFPNLGANTLNLFKRLDQIVHDVGGRLYPAKDAAMQPEHFHDFYPKLEEFTKYKDPNLSSSFWRRMMEPSNRT